MDISFIIMFFASKNVSLLTCFLCSHPADLLELYHEAGRWGVQLTVRAPSAPGGGSAPPRDGPRREGALLDLLCPHAGNVLHEASTSRAFMSRYSWLLLHNSTYNSSVLQEVLSGSAILPDADVTWAASDLLLDVYRVKTELPLNITALNITRNSTKRDLDDFWGQLPGTVTRRKNLDNVFLKTGLLLTQPQHFKGWSELKGRQIDTYPKLTYPLMNLCAEDLNFRFNIKQVDLYGEEHNGSFDGLAGLLQREQVEIGIASMFIRGDRWRVLHFCAETVGISGPFIFRQPSQSAVSNVFLLPFSRGVWCSVALVFTAAGALLAALSSRLTDADPLLCQLTLPEAFTFTVGTICQQGFHWTPRLVSARLLMFSTLLAGLFTFTAYSAKIVAILQMPSDAIQTLGDLARSPMALGIQETTYKRVYFQESADPTTQHLYRRKLLPLGERAYLSVEEGIARVRTGLFAFQVEQSPAYDIISKTFTEREKCGLKEIKAFEMPRVAVPVRKHSGYKELLAVRLRWQRETGLMGRWRRHWLAERPRCDAAGAGFLSVGLGDVLPALQVLAGGALTSTLLLFVERAARGRRSSLQVVCDCVPPRRHTRYRRCMQLPSLLPRLLLSPLAMSTI